MHAPFQTPRLLVGAAVLALAVTACASGDGDADGGAVPAGGAAALAQAGPGGGAPLAEGVTVTGEGRVSGRPDTLRATVGAEVQAETVDAALRQANERAQAVIDAVGDAGVSEDDIQTVDVSIRPRHEERPDRSGPPTISGYVVSNLLEIVIRDVDSSGEVLSAVADAGGDATRVHSVRFALEDNDALLEQARSQAFEDARAKAEQYAALADRGLGTLVSVREATSAPPMPQRFAGEAAAADTAEVPVQAGSEEVTVTVTAVWTMD